MRESPTSERNEGCDNRAGGGETLTTFPDKKKIICGLWGSCVFVVCSPPSLGCGLSMFDCFVGGSESSPMAVLYEDKYCRVSPHSKATPLTSCCS
jgi:hypothetical protein